MKLRKTTGNTPDGIPISEKIREAQKTSIPAKTSSLGGDTPDYSSPKHGPLDLNDRVPSFEKISGDED